jgi:hypothetical protein
MSKLPRGLIAYFFAMLALVLTWAVGMPRFAAPDEPAHIYKAYGTAHGQLLGAAVPDLPANYREFDGPDALGPPNLNCYNGQPDVPASCATDVSPRLISSAARYPPWYYGLVGVPVAASGRADRVWPYRFVSAVFCVALLAAGMFVAKRSVRRDLVPLQFAILTPMALFLMGSVNPNAIEIAGFVLVWACLVRVVSEAELSRRLLIVGSIVAAAVVLMRPLAFVWLCGVAAVLFVVAGAERRRALLHRRVWPWAAGPPAVALVASWLWSLYSKIEVKDPRVSSTLTLGGVLRRSIDDWPDYLRQSVGVLGWLDTVLPRFVYVSWYAALILVAVVFLREASRRSLWAAGCLVAIWLALPLAINAFTNSRAGLTYQGRYTLPLFAGLAFLPMTNYRSPWRDRRDRQWWLVGLVLALVCVAEVGAFWQMLRRFTVGADGKIVLTGTLGWEPPVAPMLLIAANAVAMLAVVWSVVRPWRQVEAAPGEGNGEGAQHRPG